VCVCARVCVCVIVTWTLIDRRALFLTQVKEFLCKLVKYSECDVATKM
jgi:hypothetical protein